LSGAAAADALVVLAGGRSSRFGGDKALAELDGETLALRALRRLAPLAAAAGADGVACARRGGRLEPLVAVWSAPAAARFAAEPAGESDAVHAALARARAACVDFDGGDRRFSNVNTRAELASVAAGRSEA